MGAVSVVDAGSSSSGSLPATDAGTHDADAGALGPDGGRDRLVQVAAGFASSCALYASGAMYCWGSNSYGQLGVATASTDRVAPVRVPIDRPVISMSVGAYTACAIDADGALRCWGDNQYGDVGVAPEVTPDCGSGRRCQVSPLAVPGLSVKRVTLGHHMGCAISQDDHVYCWGTNSASQSAAPLATRLVDPPQLVSGLAKIDKLAMGYGGRVACALDHAGAVWCWGDNHEGALGHALGTAGDVGSNPAYTNATPVKVAFPAETTGKVVDLAAAATACAAVEDGTVLCWGRNAGNELQLATPDALPHPLPTVVAGAAGATALGGTSAYCTLQGASTPLCWGPSALASGSVPTDGCVTSTGGVAGCRAPAAVPGPKLVQLSINANHALGLDADGIAYAWGDDNYGRTGIGDLAAQTDGGTYAFTPLPVTGLP